MDDTILITTLTIGVAAIISVALLAVVDMLGDI